MFTTLMVENEICENLYNLIARSILVEHVLIDSRMRYTFSLLQNVINFSIHDYTKWETEVLTREKIAAEFNPLIHFCIGVMQFFYSI